MLSVVCWRWGTRYGVEHINRLASMLRRHLHLPYRLFCITDDPTALDPSVTAMPLWPANEPALGRCRRLCIFDPVMRDVLGPRILQLDIDCIITNDITLLVDRPEPFVIWRSVPELKYVRNESALKPNAENGTGAYNTSLLLMDAGVLPTLWSDYLADRNGIEARCHKAGVWTSIMSKKDGVTRVRPLASGDDDQAVISLYARELNPPTWLERDGVYKWGRRGFADKSHLPENARIVFFNGSMSANQPGDQPWIAEHWR